MILNLREAITIKCVNFQSTTRGNLKPTCHFMWLLRHLMGLCGLSMSQYWLCSAFETCSELELCKLTHWLMSTNEFTAGTRSTSCLSAACSNAHVRAKMLHIPCIMYRSIVLRYERPILQLCALCTSYIYITGGRLLSFIIILLLVFVLRCCNIYVGETTRFVSRCLWCSRLNEA